MVEMRWRKAKVIAKETSNPISGMGLVTTEILESSPTGNVILQYREKIKKSSHVGRIYFVWGEWQDLEVSDE